MDHPSFLAVDLGAGSGRVILGTLKDRKLHIEELHRFPNRMHRVLGHLYWNVYTLFEEMKEGLKACRTQPVSMALDTWGVDFTLLDPSGALLSLPFTYRDPRTDGAMEAFFKIVPREEVYRWTGNQFMQFNSLFQLFAMKRDNPSLVAAAGDLLFMPDIFNYFFTGEKRTEFTYATTSQLYNPVKKGWEDKLFEALGLPVPLMQEVVEPGTVLGGVEDDVLQEVELKPLPVVAGASHDTGSAVAAVPAEGEDWAYISSGTWSLMGIEIPKPVITDQGLEMNFTNEGGVGGTIRFLKNIAGLWLVEQCKVSWARDRDLSYETLFDLAAKAVPFKAFIDPDRSEFLNPPDMPEALREVCKKTGQPAPENPGEFVRAILESLALKYAATLDQLRTVQSRPINRIHIIGGGVQNRMLCQFTADATNLPVLAGPVEATAVGNIMVQALALGVVNSHAEMREVIRASFEPVAYTPRDTAAWGEARDRFQMLIRPS